MRHRLQDLAMACFRVQRPGLMMMMQAIMRQEMAWALTV